MIVWGGNTDAGPVNTGGRYNPITDSWTATSTTDAPDGRAEHTAVWTGGEMIVWGGFDGSNSNDVNTGGKYNPGTDSWTATSTTNAPSGREQHTAVWTNSEMIVWGGSGGATTIYFNTGERYNPGMDSWTASSTTNAPSGRESQTAVWTGGEMIVWGGISQAGYFNTGGRYDPSTDSWTGTNITNAPSGRAQHTAVWTSSEMIVWGGIDGTSFSDTGGRYNPSTDSWTATSTTNAPVGRDVHTAVWTGSEMIVWGGCGGGPPCTSFLNSGGRYCAAAASPTKRPTPTPRPRPSPAPRPHSAAAVLHRTN